MKKQFIAIFIAIIVAFSISSVRAQNVKNLVIGLPFFYDQTFLPTYSSQFRKQYLTPLFDFIIEIDENGNFDHKRSVAYKWETSSDLRSWTLYIRKGIKFHNGDPLTIEDVKYTLEIASLKTNKAGSQPTFSSHVSSIETIPPDKVVVHLNSPWPTFPYFLASIGGIEGMVVPKKYILEKGMDFFLHNPIGSGPYRFVEWKEGVHIKYESLKSHWRTGVPYYKNITFKMIPEDGTRLAALRSGQVDVIVADLTLAKDIEKAGFDVVRKKDGLFVALHWLQDFRQDFPTHKKKVRQALIYAINKREILEQILMGMGDVATTATPMFTWAIEYKPYPESPYDPILAKKLLADAGYPDGFTMYIYSFVNKLPEAKLINLAIASYWEAIGIKTKVMEMDYTAFKPHWTKQKTLLAHLAFCSHFQIDRFALTEHIIIQLQCIVIKRITN